MKKLDENIKRLIARAIVLFIALVGLIGFVFVGALVWSQVRVINAKAGAESIKIIGEASAQFKDDCNVE